MLEGHNFYGYLPGGASGGILPASMNNIALDFDTLQEFGCFIGSAAVVVFSDRDKARDVAHNVMRFFEHESCGQCTPCREGSGWMWRILDRVVKRKATYGDVELLSDVTKQIEGHTICAFGEGSAWPVQGLLRHFRKEVESRCREEPLIKKKLNNPYLVDQHLLENKNA